MMVVVVDSKEPVLVLSPEPDERVGLLVVVGFDIGHPGVVVDRTVQVRVANAPPLCKPHNLFKQNHEFRLTTEDDGQFHIWRPDGTELT